MRNTAGMYTRNAANDINDWWSDAIYTPSRQSRPRRHAQSLPQALKKPGRTRVERRRAQALNRIGMYMAIALAVCCFFVQVARYAQIAINSKQISSLNSEIAELENQKENLELRLSARVNSERLMNEAMAMDEMQLATDEQTRYIALDAQKTRQQTILAANTAK
ncbi:MAG: hypothetical protein Q4D04_04275 [Clostridia bacterium]|nr:hypothetical protein [Clostridia bacterium]